MTGTIRAKQWSRAALWIGALVVLSSCAAGDPQFHADAPAGFWWGLWHGVISVISLVVGIFSEGVEIYERNNTGGWYDLGFLIGVTAVWGAPSAARCRSKVHHARRERDREWDDIADEAEAKVQRKIREWAEAEPDEDWEVVGEKAEAKLKRKVRAWAESP